jgi:hypothetical protein
MNSNYNRVVYQEGKKWINHRIDGRGPDSSHYKLCHAVMRAARNIKKFGDGKLVVKNDSNETLFNAKVKRV